MNKKPKKGTLAGRTLYVPRMSIDGASAFAAAFRSLGYNAQLVPESDTYTNELARQYTLGEECYPQIITLGSFLKVIEDKDFDPLKTAFMMPTTGGPCRFGQYNELLEKILTEKGIEEVLVVSPSSATGYEDISDKSDNLRRICWWAVVCSDIIRKLLLQTRPYEINKGDTDKVHEKSIELICSIMERQNQDIKKKYNELVGGIKQILQNFTEIPAEYTRSKPLIGVVGEIYCRLDNFANAELIRRIEKFGGEVWLASVSEWVWYSNFYQQQDLKMKGEKFSLEMLGALIRDKFQSKDEHKLYAPVHKRFEGYEEPENINYFLDLAKPYLPYWGVIGEMVLNIGGAIYYHSKGVDGIIDISPFTCMNGIVCEAIYPSVSTDHNGIPIKNFYFDETESDYDRDVEIFLELASTYRNRKTKQRVYPSFFENEI
jgi:predicted nucleotide-binding protein (sugar kinase/HSP70/actin superfamily)